MLSLFITHRMTKCSSSCPDTSGKSGPPMSRRDSAQSRNLRSHIQAGGSRSKGRAKGTEDEPDQRTFYCEKYQTPEPLSKVGRNGKHWYTTTQEQKSQSTAEKTGHNQQRGKEITLFTSHSLSTLNMNLAK